MFSSDIFAIVQTQSEYYPFFLLKMYNINFINFGPKYTFVGIFEIYESDTTERAHTHTHTHPLSIMMSTGNDS